MYVQVLDGSMDVGRKMKRAFCEPGNVADCPPLVPHPANIRPSPPPPPPPQTHTHTPPPFPVLISCRSSPFSAPPFLLSPFRSLLPLAEVPAALVYGQCLQCRHSIVTEMLFFD